MPQLAILEFPDSRLRLPSAPVTEFDDSLNQLIDGLVDTMAATGAIGLSAPQADDRRRVLVTDLSGNGSAPTVYVNPEILSSALPGIVEESCLSVPGVVGNVVRRTQVRVRAQDRTGAHFERDLEGMDAVALQHEIDHLDGTLFVDRLSPIRRFLFRMREKGKARQQTA